MEPEQNMDVVANFLRNCSAILIQRNIRVKLVRQRAERKRAEDVVRRHQVVEALLVFGIAQHLRRVGIAEVLQNARRLAAAPVLVDVVG